MDRREKEFVSGGNHGRLNGLRLVLGEDEPACSLLHSSLPTQGSEAHEFSKPKSFQSADGGVGENGLGEAA